MAKPTLKKGKAMWYVLWVETGKEHKVRGMLERLHSIGEDLSGRLVPHSSHPTLYVLFLITFTNPLHERLGLNRKFKRGIRERVEDTG